MTDLVALKKRFRELYEQQVQDYETGITKSTQDLVAALMNAIENEAIEMGSPDSFYVNVSAPILKEDIYRHVLDDAVPEAMKKLGFDGHLHSAKSSLNNDASYTYWFSFAEGVGDE